MKGYVLSGPAQTDLESIAAYLTEAGGVTIARQVMRELRSAMQLLGQRPGIGHLREDLTEQVVRFWPVYSYLIIYSPLTKPLEIVRVVRGSRDVPALLGP